MPSPSLQIPDKFFPSWAGIAVLVYLGFGLSLSLHWVPPFPYSLEILLSIGIAIFLGLVVQYRTYFHKWRKGFLAQKEEMIQTKIRLLENLERELLIQIQTLNESRKKIEKDIETARRIQYSTLPKLKKIPYLEIGSLYMPLAEVSGDIYDFFEPEPGVFRLLVADATGHGVQAGFLTMSIRTEYERIKEEIRDPGELMQRLNESIFQTFHDGGVFYTCLILDFSFEKGSLRYCSAGHPPFLVLAGEELDVQEANCPVIGASRDIVYSSRESSLAKDAMIATFTDGIYEFNQLQEEGSWGLSDFMELCRQFSRVPGQSFCNEILQEIASILSDNGFQDDITLLVFSLQT